LSPFGIFNRFQADKYRICRSFETDILKGEVGNIVFIEQKMAFYQDGTNKTAGWNNFLGYGQLHGTENNGNSELLK